MSIIIDIDHEGGDLTEYTSTVTDSGDLSVQAAAALAGTDYGLQCVIDDTTAIYGEYNLATSNTSGTLRIRFYLDVNSLTMANGDSFVLCRPFTSGNGNICLVNLIYSTVNLYRIQLLFYHDAGSSGIGPVNITDEPHYIEYKVVRATGESTNDGSLEWWIDGVAQTGASAQDNYTTFSNFDYVRLGAVAGLDAGTSGTFYLDELIVNDDGSEIGEHSAGTNTPLTVQDSSHAHAAESKALEVSAALAVADSAHAHAAESKALEVSAALAVADSVHAHAVEAPALSVSAALVATDAAHAHAADNITLAVTESITLTVQDAGHSHVTDNLDLAVKAALIAADTAHAHAVDNLDLATSAALVVEDAEHAHAAEAPALSVKAALAVADALHAHTADNVTITTTGQTILTVQDSGHAHSAESKSLQASAALAVADASHAHAVDAVALAQNYILLTDDALHAHTTDGIVLNAVIYLIVADALHAHSAEQVTFAGAAAGGTGTRRGMFDGMEKEMVT